jgi:cholesterol transport system auxiliary component
MAQRGMNVIRFFCAGLICLWLGGCAFAGMGSSTPPETFNLSAPSMSPASYRRWPIQLTVLRPTALRALDTDRIVVMAPGGRLSYFDDAAWSDRLTSLVQTRVVEAMQDSKAFSAVLTPQDRVEGDYTLSVEIRDFQLEVGEGQPAAVVTFFAKLTQEKAGKVIAAKEFTARVPAAKDNAAAGVASLQADFNQVTQALVDWLASARKGRSAA